MTDKWLKIPFLNGGLFSPQEHDFAEPGHINTLDVNDAHLLELFSIFSRYNFTIVESDTSDIELAVDPEMLGQIFENLFASINPETGNEDMRRNTGSYYTPRKIVDYMAQNAIIEHLVTRTSVPREKLLELYHHDPKLWIKNVLISQRHCLI